MQFFLTHSKDLIYVIKDILKCLDPKVVNHGMRTAYILYRMIEDDPRYEKYEVAEFAMIAMLHDLGAYKTDFMQDMLRYESRDCMPHSIYGYLFMQYLTPFKDRAKIILYHHTDVDKLPATYYEFMDIAKCLNIAEKMDIYSNSLGSKFDYTMFQKQIGVKYDSASMERLYTAQKKYDLFARIASGEYLKELDELFDYFIFTDEEKDGWIEGIMYCVGFRSEYTMFDMVTCTAVCEVLAEKMLLSDEDKIKLHYAAILHDAGMLAIPRDILEAPRRLTDEEMMKLRTHVSLFANIVKDRIDKDVLDIMTAHHERCDGSGYPKGLKDSDMTRLQKILQVADVVTGLTNKRSYRNSKTREEVLAILREEAERGKLSKEVTRTVINFYDVIMNSVKEKTEKTLATYHKLCQKYETTYKTINKQ